MIELDAVTLESRQVQFAAAANEIIRRDHAMPALLKVHGQLRAHKSASAGDQNLQIVLTSLRLAQRDICLYRAIRFRACRSPPVRPFRQTAKGLPCPCARQKTRSG